MYWARRTLAYGDYSPYFYRLEKLMTANPVRYSEFIMVSTKTADSTVSVYYVGVPNAALLATFDEFERVDEFTLPKLIDVVHIADTTKEPFKSRFALLARTEVPRSSS
jgi:hypothetical protein